MGKLNIAHHKSYHPYRRDNIERVRRDEEQAELERLKSEGKLLMADAEARMSVLRERSSAHKKKKRRSKTPDLMPPPPPPVDDGNFVSASGHLNFFASAESMNPGESSTSASAKQLEKRMREKEEERGVALAPLRKDLAPWYTKKPNESEVQELSLVNAEDVDSEEKALRWKSQQKERREVARKVARDPLTEMAALLSKRGEKGPSSNSAPTRPRRTSEPKDPSDQRSERLARESSERARAEALIQARRRAMAASDASSSVGGDTPRSTRGYGDVYNRTETREAAVRRGRWGDTADLSDYANRHGKRKDRWR